MERRRRSPRQRLRWTRRSGVTAGLAMVVALLAVLWLTLGSPGGARDTAAGSAATPTTSARSADVALNASGSASASASSSTSPSHSSSPSASPSASKAKSADVPSPQQPQQTVAPAGEHVITIVNADNQTIWAATNQNAQHPIPVTGWKLAPGQSVSFTVAAGWGGRVWGRTGCSFDATGSGHCQTGDCGGVFQCQGTGATPATLAELTLDSFDGLDFYDVSLVDGSNLPMYINTTHRADADPITANGCYQGACTKAIVCPSAMQVDGGAACETACAAFNTDAYCCRGAWSGRTNCDPTKWPVDYAKLVFKDAEPYAYSYAYDDSATMACKGGCYYRITFGITP